jgi:TM2 domain-containing membrane protein YozV/predicted transcriptional regulator
MILQPAQALSFFGGDAMYSVGIAYLLWLFSGFGVLGFHRFYLGKIPTGLLWMCTGGLGTIGAIYDFFTLPGQVREANIRSAIFNRSRPKMQNQSWRYVNDGEAHVVASNGKKESVERIILKLAKENKGILTVSEVALQANIPVDQAKKDLDALVQKGMAELRIRQSGAIVYTLPDFLDKDDPLTEI